MPYCRVRPPGESNSMMPVPLLIHPKSVITIVETIFHIVAVVKHRNKRCRQKTRPHQLLLGDVKCRICHTTCNTTKQWWANLKANVALRFSRKRFKLFSQIPIFLKSFKGKSQSCHRNVMWKIYHWKVDNTIFRVNLILNCNQSVAAAERCIAHEAEVLRNFIWLYSESVSKHWICRDLTIVQIDSWHFQIKLQCFKLNHYTWNQSPSLFKLQF